MKTVFLSALLLTSSVDYSPSVSHSITASLIGTWTLAAKKTVVKPKNGGVATTYSQPVLPNTVTLTYSANGQYSVVFDKSISSSGTTLTTTGTYSYTGNTITYLANGKTSTARVDTLTNTALVHVATTEDAGGQFVNITTSTYAR